MTITHCPGCRSENIALTRVRGPRPWKDEMYWIDDEFYECADCKERWYTYEQMGRCDALLKAARAKLED